VVIRVTDVALGADTADQGAAVLARIKAELADQPNQVIVSFGGIQSATTSFVNSAFVPLLDDLNFNNLKSRLKIVDSTRQINDMIRSRLEKAALVD
jgi:hypothetical protein